MSSLFDFDARPDRYAVMGNPVSHSLSPLIHAEFARQTGQRLEYTAIQVDEGGFKQAVSNFQAHGGLGLNITVPFKQEAWQLATEHSAEARRAAAVNTLMFRADGVVYGHNTDGLGLVRDLLDNHDIRLARQRLLIMGAGGAVRGILMPLLNQQPHSITIANRTVDKAQELAHDFSDSGTIDGCGYAALTGRQFDIIINGTAASMHGELPPLPDHIFPAGACCYDMMYGPEPTVFLQWAEAQGAAHCLDGLGMLVEQAALSFECWRGIRPDTAPVIALLRQRQMT